jgi:electron-transferring-flavoprotein dehydrogenase
VRGNLTKSLVRQLGLDEGTSPPAYAIGIKELWEVPAGRTATGPRRPLRWAIR